MRFSKLHIAACLAALLNQSTLALRCGISGVTKECLGDSDIRYDPEVKYDLKEQNPIWEAIEGWYEMDMMYFNEDGTQRSFETFGDPTQLGSYDFTKGKTFMKISVEKSRVAINYYSLVEGNTDTVTNTTMKDMIPGLVMSFEAHYVSTFEKDGFADLVGSIGGFGDNLSFPDAPSFLAPVANTALLGLTRFDEVEFLQVFYCVDPDCNQMHMIAEDYNVEAETGDRDSSLFSRTVGNKIEEQEWTAKLKQTILDFNIPKPDSAYPYFDEQIFLQPFDVEKDDVPECFSTKTCPGDEVWSMKDPYLMVSPFIEPSGVILDEFIAGVTIAIIVVLLVAAFFIHRCYLEKQKQRIKRHFAACVVEKIDLKASMNMVLSPESLMREFEKIDTDSNGIIRKNELWHFLSTGKVGEMSKKDFDTLFTILDIDGNGGIDFVEFCQYMGEIGLDMETIEKEIDQVQHHVSTKANELQRLSIQLAQTNARKSQMMKSMAPIEESEAGEKESLIKMKGFYNDDDLSYIDENETKKEDFVA